MKKDLAIKELISGQQCFLLGLVESKHKVLLEFKVKHWWVLSEIGWEHTLVVHGGGVITCWDKSKFEILGFMKGERWILLEGIIKVNAFNCGIIVVYAPNHRYGREQLWNDLLGLRDQIKEPLLVMGDFNEVRHVEERNGGASCFGSIREFQEWSENMMIQDMPLIGRKYTWGRGNSRSRLDRVFLDHEWSVKYPDARLRALPETISDHAPIYLSLSLVNRATGAGPFRSLDV